MKNIKFNTILNTLAPTLVLLLMVAFLATFSHAGTITTGSKKGNYYKMGIKIATQVKYKVQKSKGSFMNFDRLMSGEADIALGQKDAFKEYTNRHPEAESKIELMGDLSKECAFMIVKKDGPIETDNDLQKNGRSIAVGPIGSGSKITWEYMTRLEPAFKKASAIPAGGSRVLNKVISGKYNAALVVLTPDPKNRIIKTVVDNPELDFADIKDWDLNDKMDGKPVYSFETIIVKKGFFNQKVDTICTTASVFMRSDVDEDDMDTVADLILNNKNYILGKK